MTPRTNPPTIPGFSYVRPLGTGGFATVHLYEQDMPRRTVAVKVLNVRAGDSADPAGLRRVFENEADTMARLSSHPSIVSIYQASISLDGLPYLAMEYCPDSMGARTHRNPAPLEVILDTGVRMAGALETAHRARVLHRDIKPSNVLLTTLGRPVLSDFGISHVLGKQLGESQQRAMSIPWSAPEVVTMTTTGTVASEVWALGATLYTFGAGRSPFAKADRSANSRTQIRGRIIKAIYTAIPSGPGYEGLDDVLARAMRKKPEQRYESMAAFGRALQDLQRSSGLDVTPLEVVSPEWVPDLASHPRGPRGPVISSVSRVSRAEARAQLVGAGSESGEIGAEPGRPPMTKGLLIGGIIGASLAAAVAAALWAIGGGW